MRLAVASVLVLAGAVAVPFVARTRRPPRARIPAPVELLTSSSAFPAALPVLPPSVPLDPLLAADAPDRLALVEPTETALNVRPGEPVRVRFNRPMVDGARVGKPGGAEVLAFEPAVQGRGTWTSRSSYGFEPAATTWTATRTVTMTLAPSLRSLAGEAVAEVEGAPRTVVFDAGPRFVRTDRGRRLLPGEPLRLLFSGKVDTGALPSQLLVYEVNGGQRMIPFSVSQRALDARGLTPVELALKRTLEPGAHLAVALAPPIAYGGSHPRVVELDLSPRPRIEGIACAADATEASQCAFTGPPEAVVDVEESLILLASTELGEPKADAVETRPALDAMALKVEGGRRLSIRGDWIPGQVYEVRVGKLADKEGHPLARTAPLAVRSAGRAPEVRVAQGRLSFERGAKTMLSIQGIHVEDGEVRLGAVPPGREIEAVLSPARWLDEVMGAARASLPLHPLLPTSRPNRWGRGALDWRAATRADMAVIAMVPAPLRPLPAGGHAAPAATFVQRSDLGIDAMILPEGALVWVTSVASAEPVAGADVTVAPRPAEPPGPAEQEPSSVDGRTDERGVAWIPLASTAFLERGAAVRATHADDRAVLLVDPRSSMGPRHLGVSAGAAPPPADAWRATVFTDRGICRPGETIHAKATVRTSIDGAWVSAVSGDARLLLMGPSGQAPLAERLVALSAFGTADADFVVDGAAGTYRVEVRVPGQEAPAGSVSFEVGEYRPPSLRVDLTTTVAKLDDGDPLRMGIVARHFFGPPAAGMRAQWTLTREPDGEYPDAWEAFIFGPADATSRAGTVATGDVVLDGDGRASVETKVALGAPLRETALFSVSVRDLSGLTTTARRRVHTYPATFEVGLRRAPHWIEPGVALDLDAVVIDHEGAPQAGRTVEARILREGWHTYWEWSGHARHDDAEADEGAEPEARFQPRHARRAEVAHRCKLTSAAEPVRCAWTPDRPGTYLLEATTRDERGRTSTASERVYVAGPDEHPDRDRPGAALALTPAKRSLDTGETAEVAFESPFPDAEALLVVAREGVIHTEARRVSAGGNVLRFPVTAAMVPNAFVSLSLVRPRTGPPGRKIDLDAPDLRVGMAEIAVRPAAAPLAVKIEIAGESAPAGSDVPVAVSVLDEEGKGVPAEVALFAVDEGTLRVTGYETPDATADLFSRRPAAFAWEDLRRSLVSRVDLPLPPGGDGDGKSERSRPRDEQERFDPTPLWVGRLATDAEGKVSAVLHLPARPAQYRVMAVAVDAGVRAGHAERPITAAMPLVLRPVLPPFVTEGDRFQAVVFVHDTEDAPADVTVTAFVDGAARPSSPIHLEGKGEARVAEPIEAGSTGEVRVRFEVRSDRASAVVEKHIAVAARGRAVRSEAAFAVEGSREITVALPEPAEGRGAVTLSVARHPFVGFDTALETLLASPDEGTEPTASSVIALAAYTALDTGKRPGSVSAAELGARASQAIARLAALQAPSGGWGSFTRNDPPDGYLSAYALHALLSARRAGFTVPAAAVDGAVSHLGELARGTAFLDEKREDDLAFALRVLAEGGARDDDRNKALFDQRERLSPFGLAQLGLALATDDRRRDTLVLDAARRVLATADDEQHDPRVLRWYDGSARTLGAVLEAAIGTDVAAAQVAPLAGKLLATRAGAEAGWWSTHETSHALAALAAYAATLTFAEPLAPRVTLDGMPLGAAEQGPALSWYTLPASAGRGSHVLRIEVEGTAFFALSAGWTVPLGPDDAVARGEAAALHRVFEDATGKPLGPDAHVRLGDLVRVRLFLYSEHETPPFLAIRDRLAGGLEPLDAAHETSPRESLWALLGMGPDDDAVDVRGARAARSLDLVSHRAFLPAQAVFYLQKGTTGLQEVTYGVRATTPGTWVLPPAELDALYAPRFQARSAQATITVDP
jgi:uncharacterized protein YfaS (alpha-2-macroglobulin family)